MPKTLKTFLLFFFFLLPYFSLADSYLEKRVFFVEKNFDALKRERVLATNLVTSQNFNVYVDDDFWSSFPLTQREKLVQRIKNVISVFEEKAYPLLTSVLGKETERGINQDPKTTILIEMMKEDAGGYFREADYFEKSLAPSSNERKIIYLNSYWIEDPIFIENLIHEFTHLIIFKQKREVQGVDEERWVQEMITEVAPTIAGYSENLKRRIALFQKYPKNPILEWEEKAEDYGALSIFAHYLLDQFGTEFFSNLIKTKNTGILAIESSSQKKFDTLFRNFLIAVFLQDCNLGKEYCFQNELLKGVKIQPELHLLPTVGGSSFSIFRQAKDFVGDWQKFYGGNGNLLLELEYENRADFDFSLLLCDKSNQCQLQVLQPTPAGKIVVKVDDFSKKYAYFSVITFSKTKKTEKDLPLSTYNFSIKANFGPQMVISNSSLISTSTLPNPSASLSCKKLERNLKVGMRGEDVKCLQEFLKNQGSEIYPEGEITGYFGALTFQAVKRFQQKYWQEILAPWGLTKDQPTGFVGQTTRLKINQLISY
jgi:hypothetical protein